MNTLSSLSSVSPYVNTTSGSSVKDPSGNPLVKKTSDDAVIRPSKTSDQGLNVDELKELTDLKARDREVRAHEAAHQAAGGQHAGAISLTYERGADGAQYAVGGEVPIDVSPVGGDPQATIEKMRTVRAAALAPAEPSSQDRAVAAQAMQTILQAQSELTTDKSDSASTATETKSDAEESSQSLSNRQADDTYRSVSALAGEQNEQPSGLLDISV